MTHDIDHGPLATFLKGSLGFVSAALGNLSAIQQWKEDAAWFLGCLVAVATVVNIVSDFWRKNRKREP